jgi:hypothetical protein
VFQFALEHCVAMFGADSRAVATELSNLGNVLAEQHDLTAALVRRQGDVRNAIALLRRADAIFATHLSSNDPGRQAIAHALDDRT